MLDEDFIRGGANIYIYAVVAAASGGGVGVAGAGSFSLSERLSRAMSFK